jgi:hypothetical protein
MNNALKIDGIKLAGLVKTQASLGELGLKDGQNIVGRIISVGVDEVLLQLVGKTISAQLEGKPLLPGATVLFGVTLAESGKVALKVLTNLTQPVTSEAVETPTLNEAGLKTVIATACRQLGPEGAPVQVGDIYRDMELFAAKYGKTPPPEVFVWLRGQHWPVTPGTMLAAWLYRDQELRNLIWTRLRWIAQLRQQPELLPPVWDRDQIQLSPETAQSGELMATSAQVVDGQSYNSAMNSDRQALTDPLLHFEGTAEDKSVWEQLQPLLAKSLNLDQTSANPTQPAVTIVPLLIQTAAALVTELRLKWSAKPKQSADPECEELIRMVIPTENMGDILLTVLLSSKKTQINLKVASPAVQEYLTQNLAELHSLMDEPIYIAVGVTPANAGEAKVDLWM